jgi:hypothetical protein
VTGQQTAQAGEAGFGAWVWAGVLWLAVCAVSLCVAQLELLSVERLRSPVNIESSFAALVVGEVFFLVFFWPLFERRFPARPFAGQLAGGLVRLLALLVLAIPFVLLARRVAEVPLRQALMSQGLLVLVGAAVWGAVRMPGARRCYYPLAFLLTAVVPLAAYVLREEGGVPMGWAAAISPVWAAGGVAADVRGAAPFILFGVLAGLALGARGLAGRAVSGPERP